MFHIPLISASHGTRQECCLKSPHNANECTCASVSHSLVIVKLYCDADLHISRSCVHSIFQCIAGLLNWSLLFRNLVPHLSLPPARSLSNYTTNTLLSSPPLPWWYVPETSYATNFGQFHRSSRREDTRTQMKVWGKSVLLAKKTGGLDEIHLIQQRIIKDSFRIIKDSFILQLISLVIPKYNLDQNIDAYSLLCRTKWCILQVFLQWRDNSTVFFRDSQLNSDEMILHKPRDAMTEGAMTSSVPCHLCMVCRFEVGRKEEL